MKFLETLFLILLFCFNIVPNTSIAQTSEIDSLKQELKNPDISDIDSVNTLDLLASKLFRIDNQQAFLYLNDALVKANETKYLDGIIETKRLLGINNYYCSNHDTALTYLFEAYHYFSNEKNTEMIAKCLVNIGNVYMVMNILDSAIYYYEEALIINKNNNNKGGIATSLGNIGLVYKHQENLPKALEYYKESLKAHEEVGNIRAAASIINKISIIFIKLGRLDEALEYNKRALKISRETNDKLGEALYLNNLGVIYYNSNKNDSALQYYQQSLKLKLELNNKANLSTMYVNIGKIHSRKGDNKKAIEYYFKALEIEQDVSNKYYLSKILNTIGSAYFKENNIKKAEVYFLKSLRLAEATNSLQLQAINRKMLSKIYTKTKDFEKALVNYKLYSKFIDSIEQKQNIKKITELELEYKFKEQNKIVELDQETKRAKLSKEIHSQKKTKNTFIILFVVATIAIILFIRLLIIRIRTNKLLHIKNNEIREQSHELERKSKELTQQKTLLEETVKKRTNELLIEKEKAEESDNLKSAILNNISHEFRTPMNGIIGFTSLLIKPDNSEEEKESYSKIIINSCNQLLNVVTDTVDISKINSKQCKLLITKSNIESIITSVINELKSNYEEKGLIIETNIDIEDNNLDIETDKNKLERILWHIISNAIKFTQEGKISITVSIINNSINFEIKDTGKGIPKSMQEDIFKPFTQLNSSPSETITGNGFGLPIAKAYIELLGGEIKIDSVVDVGTNIKFYVNFKKALKTINTDEITKSANTQKTILLAEDDEINAFLIDRIFSKYSIKLIKAVNGKEATDIYREQYSSIDMVLLDLRMPVMNGFEAISIIKEINPNIPVIAYTAYCSKSEISAIMDAGFDDYISKPIQKEKLLKIVFPD
jgi:signal transduction histidine kinase/Tfp pilus assembly protein PilF